MDKIRWGIMSTAEIGAAKVIPAMQNSTYCDIQALASRSLETAKALAAKLKIPKTFGSYEELLDCAEIDAVYIPFRINPAGCGARLGIKSRKSGFPYVTSTRFKGICFPGQS